MRGSSKAKYNKIDQPSAKKETGEMHRLTSSDGSLDDMTIESVPSTKRDGSIRGTSRTVISSSFIGITFSSFPDDPRGDSISGVSGSGSRMKRRGGPGTRPLLAEADGGECEVSPFEGEGSGTVDRICERTRGGGGGGGSGGSGEASRPRLLATGLRGGKGGGPGVTGEIMAAGAGTGTEAAGG